jgi:YD repeat-containing protein
MTVAGQSAVNYSYDNADRLIGLTRGTAAVSITYDSADRRTSLTLPNGIVVEYGYDDDSRLTSLTYKQGGSPIGDLTYAHDAVGQRTTVDGSYARTGLPAALASASYDDANQIATWGGTSFTYDDNGNLTSDGVRSYTWDARNQLASLTGPVNASFGYDGLGRRRSKTIGGTTTDFLYDGFNPVQELAGGNPVANLLTGLAIDEYFTRTDAAGVRNYLTDALGSSVALVDGSGTVQTEYTYEPFGNVTTSGASTTNTIAFAGREVDGTGLDFVGPRYTLPRVQRFIIEGPAWPRSNFNRYSDEPKWHAPVPEIMLFGQHWIARLFPSQRHIPPPARPIPRTTPNPTPRPIPVDPRIPPVDPKLDPWLELLLDLLEKLGGSKAGAGVAPPEGGGSARKPPDCYIKHGIEFCRT